MAKKRGPASPTRTSVRGKRDKSPAPKMGTGRWSDEEHEKFKLGIEKHGDDYDTVAELVATRTSAQVKAHHKNHPEITKKKGRGRPSVAKSTQQPQKASRASRSSLRVKETEEPEEVEEEPTKKKQKVSKKEEEKKKKAEAAAAEAKKKEEEEAAAAAAKKKKEEEEAAAAKKKEEEEAAAAAAAKKKKEEEEAAAKKKKVEEAATAKKKKEAAAAAAKKKKEEEKKAKSASASPKSSPAKKKATSSPARSTPGGKSPMQGPGIPPPQITPGAPQVIPPGPYTDHDILLPTTSEAIATRPANREYIQLLQANCALYHSMPSPEQMWFLTNICNFLTVVRGRKLVNFHPWSGFRVLTEPPLPLMVAELNLDTFKRSAFQFHPHWLLGNHDPSSFHEGKPFLHRRADGNWKQVTMDDVRLILQGEGPKNLLILPAGLTFKEGERKDDKSPAKTAI